MGVVTFGEQEGWAGEGCHRKGEKEKRAWVMSR